MIWNLDVNFLRCNSLKGGQKMSQNSETYHLTENYQTKFIEKTGGYIRNHSWKVFQRLEKISAYMYCVNWDLFWTNENCTFYLIIPGTFDLMYDKIFAMHD